ncbi:hypothetical protein BSUW23_13150 [Bacillus spizizenii str. W23]|uniref:Uncharacterized protein n=1 Tax=Bacillus spizizenii (strain ATCC 23059 / NRRL B-14472 / W23) TaxID=655816 RepID=E0TUH2_BACSH|nr:hypothetical protein BSUW23_13150 [Bacillus spizizenii str. W23]EFG90283.1 hypothetical protein BSU6633_18937 [Bacillus spizizenii ATCC 6633 = JCM 2499]
MSAVFYLPAAEGMMPRVISLEADLKGGERYDD